MILRRFTNKVRLLSALERLGQATARETAEAAELPLTSAAQAFVELRADRLVDLVGRRAGGNGTPSNVYAIAAGIYVEDVAAGLSARGERAFDAAFKSAFPGGYEDSTRSLAERHSPFRESPPTHSGPGCAAALCASGSSGFAGSGGRALMSRSTRY